MKITPKVEKKPLAFIIELTVEEVRTISLNAEETTGSYLCNSLIRDLKAIAEEYNL